MVFYNFSIIFIITITILCLVTNDQVIHITKYKDDTRFLIIFVGICPYFC